MLIKIKKKTLSKRLILFFIDEHNIKQKDADVNLQKVIRKKRKKRQEEHL